MIVKASCDLVPGGVATLRDEADALAGSTMPTSIGDEPCAAGGVVSGMIKGPVAPKIYSTRVIVEGKGAVFHTAITAHNGSNANQLAGQQVAPSRTKVMVSP